MHACAVARNEGPWSPEITELLERERETGRMTDAFLAAHALRIATDG